MLPVIKIGIFAIPSYSLMVFLGAIAFTVTTILILERGIKVKQVVTNRLLIISLFGFAALALFAFLFNSLFHSIEEGRLVLGGITWLGGVIGAFPLTVFLIHKFCPYVKGEALRYFGYLVPGISIAHGFGRIGCFLGGCCFGGVTDSFLGVRFPEGSVAANKFPDTVNGGSLPLLPTQLIEAVFEVALFLVMILLFKRLKEHYLEVFCYSYGTFRFVLEFFRADDRGASGLGLSPSQVMSLILIAAAVLITLYKKGIIFKGIKSKMDEYASAGDSRMITNKAVTLLHQLKGLLDDGIITEEEFQDKKRQILDSIK